MILPTASTNQVLSTYDILGSDAVFWFATPEFVDELYNLECQHIRISVEVLLDVAEFVFSSMVRMRDMGFETEFDFDRAHDSMARLRVLSHNPN